jgi:hypothetical protein
LDRIWKKVGNKRRKEEIEVEKKDEVRKKERERNNG